MDEATITRLSTGLEALAARADSHGKAGRYRDVRAAVQALRKPIVAALRAGRTKAEIVEYLMSAGCAASKYALRRYIDEVCGQVRKRVAFVEHPVSEAVATVAQSDMRPGSESVASISQPISTSPAQQDLPAPAGSMAGLSKEEKMKAIKDLARRAGVLRE